jgi:NADPH2:quinone reductase
MDDRQRLRHTIGATFPLDAVVEAHECVESGSVVGNVVVVP